MFFRNRMDDHNNDYDDNNDDEEEEEMKMIITSLLYSPEISKLTTYMFASLSCNSSSKMPIAEKRFFKINGSLQSLLKTIINTFATSYHHHHHHHHYHHLHH